MGCCGKNRTMRQVEHDGPLHVMPRPKSPEIQYFKYTGKARLTAVGSVTGRRYHFSHPGALLAVDERDGPSMAGVPNLSRVSVPE